MQDQPNGAAGATHSQCDEVTLRLTPEQAHDVFGEIRVVGDWPDAFTVPGELEVCARRVESCGRWFRALEWGQPTAPVALTESVDWCLAVVAGLMYGAQYMSDTGTNHKTAGELTENLRWARKVATGAAVLEQVIAITGPLPEDMQVGDYTVTGWENLASGEAER